MLKRFDIGLGLDATQALAMLAMAYQVRPKLNGEMVEHVDGDLYIIPDICMGKSSDYEEYKQFPGCLLDVSSIKNYDCDKYVDISLNLAAIWLLEIFKKIRERYAITIEHLDFLVKKSDSVHPNKKVQFSRGLYYGCRGDYYTSSCLIAPLIEAFVRKLSNDNGISTVDKQGVPIGLGKLLNNNQVASLFAEGVMFELRAILASKGGINIRNLLAHGSIDDGQTNGIEFFYFWWFALRMVVNLHLHSKDSGQLCR